MKAPILLLNCGSSSAAGIGEHSAPLRARICAALGWLGISVDEEANRRNAVSISNAKSAVRVAVEPTNERVDRRTRCAGGTSPAGCVGSRCRRMTVLRNGFWMALAWASCICAGYAAAAEPSGHQIFELRCRSCHTGTTAADLPIGPSLAGVIGRKAGTHTTGASSRALIDSGIVWNRSALRRFLGGASPPLLDSHASFGQLHPTEVESLLDYLEWLSDPERPPAPR
jgi:cytochrome c2